MSPTPDHTAKADRFHAMCNELCEHYVGAIGHDMNAYVEKNGKPMDMTFAHNDITRVLARSKELTPAVLAGMVASFILKDIERMRRGKR